MRPRRWAGSARPKGQPPPSHELRLYQINSGLIWVPFWHHFGSILGSRIDKLGVQFRSPTWDGKKEAASKLLFSHFGRPKCQNADLGQAFEFMLHPSHQIWVPMGPRDPRDPVGSHWPPDPICLMTTSVGHMTGGHKDTKPRP